MSALPICRAYGRRHFTRREFIRSAVSAGFGGLTAPYIMSQRAVAAAAGREVKDTAVIQIWLGGGPTHFETYDPKPDAPAEYRGPFRAVPTRLPGVQVCELLPRHAALMDKLAVIRSVCHNNGDHHEAMHRCITGHPGPTVARPEPTRPSTGSVVARAAGSRLPSMPPYIHLGFKSGNPTYDANHRAAYLGGAYNPFVVTADPNEAAFRIDNLVLADGLTLDRLEDRQNMLARFDRLRREADSSGAIASMDQLNQMAFDLFTGERVRRAFDLAGEDPKLRDRYGRNRWGQSVLLARRLVEHGVSFVTVNTDPHSFTWDMHSSLTQGMPGGSAAMQSAGPMLDDMLATLVEDLCDRGLDRRVLVLVWGEFGRTPRVNATGGRDHWGEAMSVLMFGGGLRMGQVIGSTTAKGEVPKDRPLLPEDVIATMYHVLGVDPETAFADLAGRPITVLGNGGRPIVELL